VLASAGTLAWHKDVGTVMFTVFCYVPAIILLVIGLGIWAVIARRSARGRAIRRALLVVIVLVPITLWGVPLIQDHVRFLLWYPAHRGLVAQYADRDAVILHWESWGIAGLGYDSYLVSDPVDRLGHPEEQARWLRSVGSDCEIATNRMMPGLYIATTLNCPL